MKTLLTTSLLLITIASYSQDAIYNFQIDLTQVENDELKVILNTPPVKDKTIRYYMPKIVPGTYSISDYGKFTDNLQALDKKGKNLPVQRIDENTWQIEKANKLTKITYSVEDTYDTDLEHKVYPMAGSNINDNDNFVIAAPGFFGYLEGKKEMPYQITFTKPEGFYGSTGLIPTSSTATNDVFRVDDYDRLVDSPIMYNVPDTTFINVGNARVLISVYSPNNLVTSEYLASQLEILLQAEKEYLGGELPVDKYAFIFYFDPSENPQPGQGALEHSYSSFYYLSEMPQEQMISDLLNIASHEFLHIVTPLTIHSEEIANFNFNVAELSQHLWLYEGVTEYASDHVQIQQGLISVPEYLERLREKIFISKMYYNDSLPFTELSKRSADLYQDQYGNVYEKGALIAAMLDIKLNELSDGKYDLQALLRELGNKFGPDKPFNDKELFSIIEEMTYPEIGEFFQDYVAGSNPLPYEEYFQKAGINYIPRQITKGFSMGNIQIGYDQMTGNLIVADISQMNEFGKALGYQQGDVIHSIQGHLFTPQSGQQLLADLKNQIEEGDTLEIEIERDGKKMVLKQEVYYVNQPVLHSLSLMENPDYEQLKLRNNWLMANPVTARPEDVETLDAIISSIYDVISGPAGERDWDRFYSLFSADANMRAVATTPQGVVYVKMSPEEYQKRNSPVFKKSGFYEEEIHRKVDQFGNIAQVFSTYQFKTISNGPVVQRGINSIQLAFYDNRWWVTSILWSGETGEEQIPEEYLEN